MYGLARFWHDHGQLEPMGRTGFREKMKLQKEKCYPLLVLPRILMNPYNTPFLHRPLEHLHQAAGDAMDEALELLEGEHASVKSQRGSQTGGCKDRTLSGRLDIESSAPLPDSSNEQFRW